MTRLSVSGAAVGALLLSAASLASLAALADPTPGATPSPNAATSGSNSITVTKPGDSAPEADWQARRRADHEAFFAARLASLHAGLQLKPDQDGLWAPVEAAIRDLAKAHGHHLGQRDARAENNDGGRTASHDDLRARSARLIRVGNALKALADAADPLVASMTPDQKDRLPRLLDGLRPRRVLMLAFGLEGDREAMEDGRETHRWRRDAERDDDGRREDGRRHGFEDGFEHHGHGGWTEGDRDDGSEWHHRRHHHDDENADEPMHS